MAGNNDMYDDSEPSTAQNPTKGDMDEEVDETDDQLALVPNSFFQKKKGPLKPGMRETVEIVNVYEGEVAIKCIYTGDEEEEEAEEEYVEAEAEPEDEMMV